METEHIFEYLDGTSAYPAWYMEYEIVSTSFRLEHNSDGDTKIVFIHTVKQ